MDDDIDEIYRLLADEYPGAIFFDDEEGLAKLPESERLTADVIRRANRAGMVLYVPGRRIFAGPWVQCPSDRKEFER